MISGKEKKLAKLQRSSHTGVTDVGESIEISVATWEVLKALSRIIFFF